MIIRCPSCGDAFEMSEAALGVKATVPCPLCTRVIVVRDAQVVPPAGDHTVPFDAWTEVALPPAAGDEATAVTRLAMPEGKRVSLAILTGPRKGQLLRLDRPRVMIGREGGGAGAAVEIPDPEASRSHAAIECHGERVELRDPAAATGPTSARSASRAECSTTAPSSAWGARGSC